MIAAAELAAEGLRARLDGDDTAADPFAALEHLGVAVLRAPLKVEGAYRRADGQAFAAINSLTDVTRQRFTAAHELGHHVMYDETTMPPSLVDVVLGDDDEAEGGPEAAADTFAAAFLMPEAEVRRVTADAQDPLAIMVRVMVDFDVSKPAAIRRCAGLGLMDAEDAAKLARDKRSIPSLCEAAGVRARPKRSKGQRTIDRRHVERVRRLARAGVVSDQASLLSLT